MEVSRGLTSRLSCIPSLSELSSTSKLWRSNQNVSETAARIRVNQHLDCSILLYLVRVNIRQKDKLTSRDHWPVESAQIAEDRVRSIYGNVQQRVWSES